MIRPLLAAALVFAVTPAFANPFDDFKNQAAAFAAADASFEAMAKDLGGILGSGDFHSARVPGLGGFDIGARAALQSKPDDKNGILKAAGVDAFGLPALRVEAGLPLGFSIFARGIPTAAGASLMGAGARFQLYKSGLVMAIPDVAVTAAMDKLSHDVLDATHLGASVQASFNIPIIKPFVGFGVDRTKLTVKHATVKTALALAGNGNEFTGSGTRMTVGASMTPFPLTYIFGAYTVAHGQGMVQAGLGMRFGGIL